jgi:photosystem II stability/assembly factor-like uncharacterized protein
MPEQVFIVTGEDVVRMTLSGAAVRDLETVLAAVGARCVAVDPNHPNRVYVGTFDNGLFASADGGEHWQRAETGLAEHRVLAVSVSPTGRGSGPSVAYAGTEPSNLYRSEDGGRSWELLPALRQLPSEPNWSFPPRPWTHHVRTIALHPTDPDQLVVGIELGGVMRSHDGGESWIDHNPQAHSDAHQLLISPVSPDRVYEAAGQGIALSDDLGESWRRYEDGLDRRYGWAVAVDPLDPDLWYVSVSRSPFAAHGDGDGEARLLRSGGRNGGNGDLGAGTWMPIDTWGTEPELRRMPYALATLPGQPGRLLVGLRGGTLLVTGDAGDSWSRLGAEVPGVVDFAVARA